MAQEIEHVTAEELRHEMAYAEVIGRKKIAEPLPWWKGMLQGLFGWYL